MESHDQQQNKPVDLPVGKLLEGLPFEEYAAAEGINAGGLKLLAEKSPAHFWEERFGPKEDKKETKALRFGKLFHYAVLEPHIFQSKAIIVPVFEGLTKDGKMSTRSGAALEKKKEWFAQLPKDAIICEQDELSALLRMCDKILKHPRCRELLTSGVKETTLTWVDPVFGVKCKIRPDFISSKGHCVDLKSTIDASEGAFKWQIEREMYDLSAAHYTEGGRVTGTFDPRCYMFLAIEKTPPYEIGIYNAGHLILEQGHMFRNKGMRVYTECLKNGKWPGYSEDIRTIDYEPDKLERTRRRLDEPEELPDFLKESHYGQEENE